MRLERTYPFQLSPDFKKKLLHWAQQHEEVIWLDSNSYPRQYDSHEAILAVDAFTVLKTDYFDAFGELQAYQETSKDWLFGYLSYDLKNDVERLTSRNHDGLHFPELYFFQPKKIFFFSKTSVTISYLNLVSDEIDEDWNAILHADVPATSEANKANPIKIHLRTSKDAYFEKVNQMLSHIERGDIYEANFCQEFYAEDVDLSPLRTYWHLNTISQSPFALFLKLEHHYAFSASPERYLKRTGEKVISQPIKGTAKRAVNASEDAAIALALQQDPKERSENIMIVDLVRNDLSRVAVKGSVTVEELCGVYTFEQVHQLISTIGCEVPMEKPSVEIIKNTFPMGSMTGAPKVSAMKIIETLEDAKRGLYSGAIGYFAPNGDFDFNVVIRSIFFNQKTQYVSYSVGGAITAGSIPEREYEECLLKAKAMREALEGAH